ncbi:MAG: MFS transporter, partial [Crenarchaeota archaeon]|nr:MFS transporter [Thermoproteota archaeon]
IVASGFLISLIGTPLCDILANLGSWRFAFLLLVFPTALIGIIFSFFGIPSIEQKKLVSIKEKLDIRKVTKIFLDKSVLSCIIGGFFFTGAVIGTFAIAFYRLEFSISRTESVYILLMIAFLAILGSFIPSKLKHRFSIKSLTVISVLGNGICNILIFLAPSLWLALTFNFITTVFITMATSSYHCLVLEQVPQFCGTTVSLFRVTTGIGLIIAPALAGSLLVMFTSAPTQIAYLAAGIGIGTMNIVSACIIYFFTKGSQKSAD